MTNDDIVARLKEFFAREVLEGQEVGLDGSTKLLELGLLNSMSLLMMLSFIEKDLGVVIPREEVKPEHVTDLASIAAMIQRSRPKT